MGRTIRGVCWALFLVVLGFDLFNWGGLAITPVIGKQLREQASLRNPLAATYLGAGRALVDGLGMHTRAADFAHGQFRPTLFDEPGLPQTVVERTLSAQSATGSLCYYGAPILLVLSLVLHLRRQKRIRSFGRRG